MRAQPTSAASVRTLQTANQRLKREVVGLRNSAEAFELRNSLASLLGAAQAQDNITSWNTLIANNNYAPLTINWNLLTYMYKTHGLVQALIDMPVEDALAGGFEMQSGQLSEDELSEINDEWVEYGLYETLAETEVWARLYGGAGIIVNTDQDPSTPLDFKRKLGKLEFISANRWELSDPKGSESYTFYGKKIHASRVITLSGKKAPYIIRWQLQGWGMSELERIVQPLNIYLKTDDVVYELLEEAKIDVYRLKNFNKQMLSDKATNATQRRIQMMNKLKNFNRAVVMDMEDEYAQKQMTFSGLAEVMKQNMVKMAAALRMPLTKVWGISAAGFSSGEEDTENYNRMVESNIRAHLRRPAKQMMKIYILAKYGREREVKLDFKPLRTVSSTEEEAIKTSKHNRYLADYDKGLLTAEEYGDLCHKDNLIPIEIGIQHGDIPEPPAQGGDDDGGRGGDAE